MITHKQDCDKSLAPRHFEHLFTPPGNNPPYVGTVSYCAECGAVEEIAHTFKNVPKPKQLIRTEGFKQPTNWIKWIAYGGAVSAITAAVMHYVL